MIISWTSKFSTSVLAHAYHTQVKCTWLIYRPFRHSSGNSHFMTYFYLVQVYLRTRHATTNSKCLVMPSFPTSLAQNAPSWKMPWCLLHYSRTPRNSLWLVSTWKNYPLTLSPSWWQKWYPPHQCHLTLHPTWRISHRLPHESYVSQSNNN